MESLIINATKTSPEVLFDNEGHFKIEGKIITENAVLTFDPIFSWVKEFHGHHIVFDVRLDYINTSATMQLFSLLTKFEEFEEVDDITVNWYYEEDDEDHYETGLMFEDRLDRVAFNYIEVIDEDVKFAA